MTFIFRQATEQDFEAVAKLVTTEEELYLISPKSHFPWTAEQVQAIAETRQFNTVGVDADTQKIIAFANMYNLSEKSAFIGNMIVNHDYRCQSVGKKLMQNMIAICKNQ